MVIYPQSKSYLKDNPLGLSNLKPDPLFPEKTKMKKIDMIEYINKKLDKFGLERFLLFIFIFTIILMVVWLKFLGASNVPINVEKDGYCKMTYGEDFKIIKDGNICYNSKERIEFLYTQFRETCSKNNLLSIKFYSDCFHNGGSIN